LLIPGEDDLDAAARGVTRINNHQRVHCGAAPSKALQPTAPAAPAAAAPGPTRSSVVARADQRTR
jgi:hypothetical protein